MTPTSTVEVALLQRLVSSPYTRKQFWDERPRIAIEAGQRWVVRDRGLWPAEPADAEPVDATIRCAEADLAAMLAGRAPEGPVSSVLGQRDGADRRKQARVVLALAALGWCGPWPDPAAAPEHVHMVRNAHYDLGIGPGDRHLRLFPEGGPLPDVAVRLTHGVSGIDLVTSGLADVVGRPELAVRVPPRVEARVGLPALRAAALWSAEHAGALPTELVVRDRTFRIAPHPRFPNGLALPNQLTWLLGLRG